MKRCAWCAYAGCDGDTCPGAVSRYELLDERRAHWSTAELLSAARAELEAQRQDLNDARDGWEAAAESAREGDLEHGTLRAELEALREASRSMLAEKDALHAELAAELRDLSSCPALNVVHARLRPLVIELEASAARGAPAGHPSTREVKNPDVPRATREEMRKLVFPGPRAVERPSEFCRVPSKAELEKMLAGELDPQSLIEPAERPSCPGFHGRHAEVRKSPEGIRTIHCIACGEEIVMLGPGADSDVRELEALARWTELNAPTPAPLSSDVSRLPEGSSLGAMRGEKAMSTTGSARGDRAVLRRGLKRPDQADSEKQGTPGGLRKDECQKSANGAREGDADRTHESASESGTAVQESGDQDQGRYELCRTLVGELRDLARPGDQVEREAIDRLEAFEGTEADVLRAIVIFELGGRRSSAAAARALLPQKAENPAEATALATVFEHAAAARREAEAEKAGIQGTPLDATDVRPATVDRDFRELPRRKGDEGAPRSQTPGAETEGPPAERLNIGDRVRLNRGQFEGCKGTVVSRTELVARVEIDGKATCVGFPIDWVEVLDEPGPWGNASRKGLRERTPAEVLGLNLHAPKKTPHDWTEADHLAAVAATPKKAERFKARCPRCEHIMKREGYAPVRAACEHCGEWHQSIEWVPWEPETAAELKRELEAQAVEEMPGQHSGFRARFADRSEELLGLDRERCAERAKEEIHDAAEHVREAMYALGRGAAVSDKLGDPALARWLREASEKLHEASEHAQRVTVVLGLPNTLDESTGLEWWVSTPYGDRVPAKLLRRHGPLVQLAVESIPEPSWWNMGTWEPLDNNETGPRQGWTLEVRGGVR